MTWQQIVAVCFGVATIIGAGAALGKVALALWRVFRRLVRMLDDWLGEPEHPGIPGTGRPGVLARLAAIEEGLRATRDVQAEHGGQLAVLSTRVARLEQELQQQPERRPAIEAGGTGFQAERAAEAMDEAARGVRIAYGFVEQRSR